MNRKICIALLLALLGTLPGFEPPFAGNARPPRVIRTGPGSFARFAPGEKKIAVVIEKDAPRTTRFAASELKTFLGKRLNVSIPVVNAPLPEGISIFLGVSRWSRAAGIDDSRLCRDGFIIRTVGKGLYILGRDDPAADPWDKLSTGHHLAADQCYERGTLFGVYDFLERFAGVRFFFPAEEGIVIPQGPFTVPETAIFDRPDFEVRWYSPYNGYWPDEPADPSKCRGQVKKRGRAATPAKNLSWYRNRMQTKHFGNSHGVTHLNLVRRFHKTHPEYFALKPDGTRDIRVGDGHSGHLCFNSGVGEVIFQDVKAYLTGKPASSRGIPRWNFAGCGEGMISLAQPDSWVPCMCPACRVHFSGSAAESSAYIWRFVCGIARRVRQEKIPGAVLNLAYQGYRSIPDVEIPDNLLVQVAIEGPWGERFPEIQKKNDRLVRDWSAKKKGDIWLWNYALKWGVISIPDIPACAPRAFAAYYTRMAPYIRGAFTESGTDHFIFNYLTYYIFGKVAWNNKADTEALFRDHAVSMFGPAAEEMTRFLDRFEYLWLRRIIGKTVETPLGPVPVTASAAELWGSIYSAEELASLRALLARAEKKAAKEPQTLKRIRFVGRGFLAPVEKAFRRNAFLRKSIAGFSEPVTPRRENEKIVIDGIPDEPVWKRCPPLYMQPFKRKKSVDLCDTTKVRVTCDRDFLYLAFECAEPEPEKVHTPTADNRENRGINENSVELFLDPDPAGRSCYHMIVTSRGAVFRMKWKVGGNKFVPEKKWEGAFRIKTRFRGKVWYAEAAIPWKALPEFDGKTLKANFTRNQIKEKTALYSWSPFMENNFHEIRNFGTLDFSGREARNILRDGAFAEVGKSPRKVGAWGIPKADAAVGKIELDPRSFIRGGQSLKLAGLKNRNERTGIVQTFALKPRTTYVLSFYAKTEKVLPFDPKPGRGAAVVLRCDGKNMIFPRAWLVGTLPWTRYVFEFTTGELKDKGSYVFLRLAWASGSVWFDDVRIEEIGPEKVRRETK